MNSLLEYIDETFAMLAEFFNSTNLQMFLLVGTGLLTVGLLILALTRWGHSRPLWKCVVLSVSAHILLLGYAYGTRLILVKPTQVTANMDSENDDPMEVNLVNEANDEDEIDKRVESEKMSWNDFGNEQPLPDLAPLPRPKIDSEIVIKREPLQPPVASEEATLISRFSPMPEADPIESAAPELAIVQPDPTPELIPQPLRPSPTQLNVIPQRPEFNVPEATTEFVDEMFAEDGELKLEDDTIEAPQLVAQPEADQPEIDNSNPWNTSESSQNELVQDNENPWNTAQTLPDLSPQSQAVTANRSFQTSSRSPIRIGDGKPVPKMYQLRSTNNRRQMLEARGGSVATEQAVEEALIWLANHQEPDGRWDSSKHGGGTETRVFGHNRDGAGANADTGITGLALLAFLAGGHSHMEGPWQESVRGGISFLIAQQDSTGSLAGEARLFARMYCHSMSLLALSEAWAMTGDPKLREAVERGVNYSIKAQNRFDGGWRYQPGDQGDMSQFGWQALALHSAEIGGIDIPRETVEKMHAFIDSCAVQKDSGVAAYRPGHAPSVTMTAESLVARYVLGQSVSDRVIREAKFEITGDMPNAEKPNLYYWYYGTMALYFAGGPEWEQWNEKVKSALLSTQEFSGDARGSWEPNGVWASYGGRVYSTAVSALILEVYYRYLPTTQQPNERFAAQEEIRSR